MGEKANKMKSVDSIPLQSLLKDIVNTGLFKFFYSFTWNSVLLSLLALKPTSIEAADWQIHQKIHQSGFGLSKATNQNQTHREIEHGKAC